MNAQTRLLSLMGAVGPIEYALDVPAQPRPEGGVAVIAHPHPLFGGTLHNKVVQTLARAYLQAGWQTVRPHFRGVGGTAGQHDAGVGETEDTLQVIQQCVPGHVPLALAGFSFGAFVISQALARLEPVRWPHSVVLVGTAASRFSVAPIEPALHDRTLAVHGEIDDTVPLSSVLDWARPQHLPVTVVPGVAHFFHGQLPLLKTLVLRHLGQMGAGGGV